MTSLPQLEEARMKVLELFEKNVLGKIPEVSKYDKGHKIIIFTGRYMGRNNDNPKKAYKQGYKFTLDQLKNWGLKFHRLHMGKPTFDILVDDKSLGFKKDWYKKI